MLPLPRPRREFVDTYEEAVGILRPLWAWPFEKCAAIILRCSDAGRDTQLYYPAEVRPSRGGQAGGYDKAAEGEDRPVSEPSERPGKTAASPAEAEDCRQGLRQKPSQMSQWWRTWYEPLSGLKQGPRMRTRSRSARLPRRSLPLAEYGSGRSPAAYAGAGHVYG